MRLLVRLPRWLGDVVMAEPTLHALHRELGPGLTVAGGKPLLQLLRPVLPSANLLPSGRRPDHRSWRGHDAALLMDGSLASAWAAVVVLDRRPILTRCSGQSNSIIVGTRRLRLTFR